MPLKSLVKVSHLSNLSDARYCAGMGVEMLGFRVIVGSEYYMTPQVFQDIRGWISGPRIVAELYGITRDADIRSIIRTYAPDYLELSHEEYERVANALPLPCIISVSHASQIKTAAIRSDIAYVIAEEHMTCDDISASPYPVLVKTTSIVRLHEQLTKGCFKGFVVEGPYESRPGVTNYDQLGVVLEALDDDS